MKAIQLPSTRSLKSSQFCLLGTGAALLAIHLTLTYHDGVASVPLLSASCSGWPWLPWCGVNATA